MGDMSNKYVKFEEDNWTELAEKFIARYPDKWVDLVDEEWQKTQEDMGCIDDDSAQL